MLPGGLSFIINLQNGERLWLILQNVVTMFFNVKWKNDLIKAYVY